MSIRTHRSLGQFDHRLENLEARSLMAAAAVVAPPHVASQGAVVVADEAFLNAKSDAKADTRATVAPMYDFGGAWGSASVPAGESVSVDDGTVDQDPGHPGMWLTPSDLSTTVPGYQAAGPYAGDVQVTLDDGSAGNATTPTEEVVIPADAPVAATAHVNQTAPAAQTAPATPSATAAPSVFQQAPAAGSIGGGGSADGPGMSWLETPDALGKTTKEKAAAQQQVVIVSNFVGQ